MSLFRFEQPQPMTPQEIQNAGSYATKAQESRQNAMQVFNVLKQMGYDQNTVFYRPETSPNDYQAAYVFDSPQQVAEAGFNPNDVQVKSAQDFAGIKDHIHGNFVPGIGPNSTFARAYNNSFVTVNGKTYAVNNREGFTPLQGQLRNAGSIDVGHDAPALQQAITQTGSDQKAPVSQGDSLGVPAPGTNGALPAVPQSAQQVVDAVTKVAQNNPELLNGDITDQTLNDLLDQAKKEMGPYFDQLYNQGRYDLERGLNSIKNNLTANENQAEQQYGRSLTQLGDQAGASGRTFSLGRQRQEGQLASDTQFQLDQNRQQAMDQAQNLGLSAERQLGSSNLPTNLASITDIPRPTIGVTGQGMFARGSGSRSLYTPVGNTTGTTQYNQNETLGSRATELYNNLQNRNLNTDLAFQRKKDSQGLNGYSLTQ